MTTSIAPPVEDDRALGPVGRRPSRWRVLRRPGVALGLLWLVVVVVASAGRSFLAPYDPLVQDLYHPLTGPSAAHLLGADSLGRDVLSRLMYGAPATLLAAGEAVLVAVVIGVPLGIVSGYRGGFLGHVAGRVADLFFSLPALVILMAIVSIFGRGIVIPMAALGVIASASFIRLASACAQQVKAEPFIDAAKVSGVRPFPMVARHVLPNVATPVVIQATLTFGVALLVQSGLGFLGLGAQPPSPDWGAMVADAALNVSVAPLSILPAGLCIALTVMAVNFIGEGIQDTRLAATRTRPAPTKSATKPAAPPTTPLSGPASLTEQRTQGVDMGAIDQKATLSVRNLTVAFGSGADATVVVDGVSFDVPEGEVVGLVGESGCGKSVTALSLLGLLPGGGHVVDGTISVVGHDVTGTSAKAFASLRGSQVGYIPQEPMSSLDPSFTVAAHLVELIRRHQGGTRSAARTRAAELLRLVEVPHPDRVLGRYPHQLSGGMAQRVLIAMALAGEPKLLIADEPTTALDVTVQSEILDLLRSLQEEIGMSMLLITHDFGVVADICQRVVVMYAGQIVEITSADAFFRAPAHPYCIALMQSNPELSQSLARLPSIEGEVPPPGRWPTGCRFADRCTLCIPDCRSGPIGLLGSAQHAYRCIRAEELTIRPAQSLAQESLGEERHADVAPR